MFEVIEKHSPFLRTYYCIYLGDWLVLQTKNARLAALCQIGRAPRGLLEKIEAKQQALAEQELQPETAA